MNIKEYIESGIIETCVLGLGSEAECREFEALCIRFPEIDMARSVFEQVLEEQLMKKAIVPPSYLKEKIFSSLKIPDSNGIGNKKTVHQMPDRLTRLWKYVAAACIVLLAGTVYWASSFKNKYQELIKNNNNIDIANRRDHSNHFDAIIALNSIVQRPTVKWSTMIEPANASHCMAHIYWDSISKNTFLLVGNIPNPLSDKQFQLWATLNGQAVNLGIFDNRKEGQLLQMKNIQDAKSFYITIEPIGGSDTPTMQATYATGKL